MFNGIFSSSPPNEMATDVQPESLCFVGPGWDLIPTQLIGAFDECGVKSIATQINVHENIALALSPVWIIPLFACEFSDTKQLEFAAAAALKVIKTAVTASHKISNQERRIKILVLRLVSETYCLEHEASPKIPRERLNGATSNRRTLSQRKINGLIKIGCSSSSIGEAIRKWSECSS